jgi:hypothetical protein
MVEHLADLLGDFPGETNRTRCFLHIVNLVAQTLKKQFDLPKKGNKGNGNGSNSEPSVDEELAELAANIELEEDDTQVGMAQTDVEADNMDGWVDEVAALSVEERTRHDQAVRPLRIVLVKVRVVYWFHFLSDIVFYSFASLHTRSFTRLR